MPGRARPRARSSVKVCTPSNGTTDSTGKQRLVRQRESNGSLVRCRPSNGTTDSTGASNGTYRLNVKETARSPVKLLCQRS